MYLILYIMLRNSKRDDNNERDILLIVQILTHNGYLLSVKQYFFIQILTTWLGRAPATCLRLILVNEGLSRAHRTLSPVHRSSARGFRGTAICFAAGTVLENIH
jgi:hypothetical protein